jgi:FMN phosphatase YigB (HAD superfamily)
MKKLLIFDFDGVLAIKWTQPPQCYPQIPSLIKYLSQDYLLCVASFNPIAEQAIKNWQLHEHFVAIRSGCNYTWNKPYKNALKHNLSKSEQIINMCNNEMKNYTFSSIFFFDDDPENIKNVNDYLPHIKTVLIDSLYGLKIRDITYN